MRRVRYYPHAPCYMTTGVDADGSTVTVERLLAGDGLWSVTRLRFDGQCMRVADRVLSLTRSDASLLEKSWTASLQ